MIFTTQFDTIFDELLKGSYSPTKTVRNYNVKKAEDGYVLTMALPGLTKKDVSVEIDRSENEVVISVEEGNVFINKFTRRFVISTNVDTSKISADVKNGILTLDFPFSEDQSTVKIL